jgi:hypothetical protein
MLGQTPAGRLVEDQAFGAVAPDGRTSLFHEFDHHLRQAMYSFSSLEGMVVWVAERMSSDLINTD